MLVDGVIYWTLFGFYRRLAISIDLPTVFVGYRTLSLKNSGLRMFSRRTPSRFSARLYLGKDQRSKIICNNWDFLERCSQGQIEVGLFWNVEMRTVKHN